jgi:hypothetical protein
MDEATMFAVALMNEAQARTRRSDDWEQDIERLQQLAVDAERRRLTSRMREGRRVPFVPTGGARLLSSVPAAR